MTMQSDRSVGRGGQERAPRIHRCDDACAEKVAGNASAAHDGRRSGRADKANLRETAGFGRASRPTSGLRIGNRLVLTR